MKNLIFLILITLSIVCYSQKIEKFQIIDKGENISRIIFGPDNDLFVLNHKEQVKKVNIDSLIQSYTFDVNAKCIGVSASSESLAFGTSDGNLLFFNNQQFVKKIKAHQNQITRIAFSSSGKYVATSSLDSLIKIWSVKTFDLLHEIRITSDLVSDIKFSLDDEFLVYSSSAGKVSIWSLDGKTTLAAYQISKKWIRSIAICPDSTRFAVCGDDKKITILSFKKNDYYELKKSHRNIISDIQFINKDYLISIGHDNRIVMNNINLPTEMYELKHFSSYPRYNGFFYENSGDKYFSDLAISDGKKIVAVSSYGKGIGLTNYFHTLIENPHKIIIEEVDDIMVDSVNVKSEFRVKRNSFVIKGRVTRPEEIKNAWLYMANDEKKIKLNIDKNGEFKQQIGVYGETYDYSIIVEDWDKYLNSVNYNFRLILSN